MFKYMAKRKRKSPKRKRKVAKRKVVKRKAPKRRRKRKFGMEKIKAAKEKVKAAAAGAAKAIGDAGGKAKTMFIEAGGGQILKMLSSKGIEKDGTQIVEGLAVFKLPETTKLKDEKKKDS